MGRVTHLQGYLGVLRMPLFKTGLRRGRSDAKEESWKTYVCDHYSSGIANFFERVFHMVHHDLGMRRLSDKLIPNCLNADQKYFSYDHVWGSLLWF